MDDPRSRVKPLACRRLLCLTLAVLVVGGCTRNFFRKCADKEVSTVLGEKDAWGNGAFTKVLVDGINGGADLRNTGRITQKGLDFYLADEVPKLTRGLQTPLTIIPFGTPDFPIFERVKTAADAI